MIYIWSWMQTLGVQLRRDERGATMVEYGLLVTLIAVLLVGAILALTGALDPIFRDAGDEISNPGPIP